VRQWISMPTSMSWLPWLRPTRSDGVGAEMGGTTAAHPSQYT
jgi:hypothetical protein